MAGEEVSGRSGGEMLVDALALHGIDTIFGVPGESALPVFDALHDGRGGIRFVTCRHEANAANMAEADAKLRGAASACLVSRGPGAMHAAIAVHTAFQDSTPLLLVVGQVPRHERGREAFQEMDYEKVFGSTAKAVAELASADEIPATVARLLHAAQDGRPGPVVLACPEDVLGERSGAADVAPLAISEPLPSAADMMHLDALLRRAERPLAIVGGTGWTAEASARLAAFAGAWDLPVAAGFRSQDILDNREETYAGDLSFGTNPALAARIRDADLILAIGDRLGEVTSGRYRLIEPPEPRQILVHVFPGKEELGRVYRPTLAIHSGAAAFVAALSSLAPPADPAWRGWRRAARDDYRAYSTPAGINAPFDLAKALKHLRDRLPDDAVVTNGAGNFAIWLHRYFPYYRRGTQLAPKSGAMGYGLPAAIAAQLRHPGRRVVVLAGDGDFQMASADFVTAVRYRLPILVMIVNNGLYGTIRMHQERAFPGRATATDLENPDFVAYAAACGAHGEAVERDEDFPGALDRALAAGRPAILDLRVDPRRLSPDMVLDG